MYLINRNHKFHYETENLLRVFFPEKITVCDSVPESEDYCLTELELSTTGITISFEGNAFSERRENCLSEKMPEETEDSFLERRMAQQLFEMLVKITGYTPPWGILTGVRPAKLMRNLISLYGESSAVSYFMKELRVSKEKTELALTVARAERPIIERASSKDFFSLYVSVPFCPSRCSYCSFISHSNESAKRLIPEYVEKLCLEIEHTGKIVNELGLRLESVYIGGGTPTVLSASQLKAVTDKIAECFRLDCIREYTIEAGRPDSITEDKLRVIKQCGATRISINPQSFNDGVLKAIGRNHSASMTLEAFDMARKEGFDNINMDLIAGLPEDTAESFGRTLDIALEKAPENITVHTLALKRSSNIVTDKRSTNSGELAGQMLSLAQERLLQAGYLPYYMYRQSKCLGNLENVGWSKNGYEGLYNVYMMEECHTILSVGAGAVIKLKSPSGEEIERIFNYKYPYEYISGFEEILRRKKYIGDFYKKHSGE